MKRYRVWLDPEYRWATAQVNAREFTKTPVVLQEVELTEEIRNSPLLVVEEVDADLGTEDGSEEDPISEGVDATEGARALAAEIRNSPLLVVEEVETDLRTEDGSEEGDADLWTEDGLSEGVDATDGARALAAEMGLPLGAIVGSGTGGRVTKRDVERALGGGG